jgi:ribosomal protein S18 acetylase RimI-like enzyme
LSEDRPQLVTGGPAPPLTDTSPEGLVRAIEADSIGTRILNPEIPLEAHLDPDAAWAIGSIPDPFRNVVVSARFDAATADRRIADLAAAFRARGTAFLWWRAPFHTPADLGARLERAGITSVGSGPAMALDLRDLPGPEAGPAGPAGLEIRGVTDEAALRVYIKVLGAEPPPEGAPPIFRPAIVRAILAHTGPRLRLDPTPMRYVGWVDGRPVAASRLSLAGGTAGIYAVATLPAFRGRGIGRAMTLAPLRAARELGYRIATLQSTEAGFGVYRGLGFVEVFRYEIHVGGVPT